ncbi:MAG: hypothetical protein J5779_01865 [Clostridia bacterium]|nr:hypothetical protein [Clostridia bacterium]
MFNFFAEIKKDLKLESADYQMVNVSGKGLYVEGQKGLLNLSSELVMFKTKNKIISVYGKNLKLKTLSSSTISILGEITTIEIN